MIKLKNSEKKTQRFHSDREAHGPDFDNRLIKLVRANPVIYDVNHPHYRRNPIRVTIWERIASELGAPSKFLQTKWKNIRYNYLQELKCHETGQSNINIRKRRFTEDLSFLQNTAQTYNVKNKMPTKGPQNNSDNDSNSFVCSDPQPQNSFEVIEIENSDDSFQGDGEENSNGNGNDVTLIQSPKYNSYRKDTDMWEDDEGTDSPPLLTPLVSINENPDEVAASTNGEVTIEPIPKTHRTLTRQTPTEIIRNASKRKSMPAPFPVLTPINDPVELYCLSLVDSLRNMPRSELERVKFEFAKILKDARYKDDS